MFVPLGVLSEISEFSKEQGGLRRWLIGPLRVSPAESGTFLGNERDAP